MGRFAAFCFGLCSFVAHGFIQPLPGSPASHYTMRPSQYGLPTSINSLRNLPPASSTSEDQANPAASTISPPTPAPVVEEPVKVAFDVVEKKEESEAFSLPIPSYGLLVIAVLLAISFVGSITELAGGKPIVSVWSHLFLCHFS